MKLTDIRVLPTAIGALLLSLFSFHTLEAQSVKTSVSTDSLTVGEEFHYAIILQMDKEYDRIEFPDTSYLPSGIDLVDKQQFKVSDFTDSLSYKLQFFSINNVSIPPLPVYLYSGTDSTRLYTTAVPLHFVPTVAKGDTTFKPLKPIYDFPRLLWPWILGGLLILAIILWWIFFREKEQPIVDEEPVKEVKPYRSPIKVLEQKLNTLKEQSDLKENRAFKPFYSEVSDAIRTYFEDLYEIPALESTSRELLRYLVLAGTDRKLVDYTRQILHRSDLVKFAKYSPTLDHAWQTWQYAMDFLERAKEADAGRVEAMRAKYNKKHQIDSEEQNTEATDDGMG